MVIVAVNEIKLTGRGLPGVMSKGLPEVATLSADLICKE